MVLVAKSKLNSIEFLISKILIDSNISHDKLVLINNVLKILIWRKKLKILILNKFVWCNKININIRKRV